MKARVLGAKESRQWLVGALFGALAVLLSYPVAADAAGQLVTLVDTDGTSQTQVDNGALRVGDGSGPLTVDGSLGVRLGVNTNPWRNEVGSGGNIVLLFQAQAPVTRLAITSLTYMNTGTQAAASYVLLFSGSNCSGSAIQPYPHVVIVPPNGTVHAAFPAPLVITATPPRSICYLNSDNGALAAVGFYQ